MRIEDALLAKRLSLPHFAGGVRMESQAKSYVFIIHRIPDLAAVPAKIRFDEPMPPWKFWPSAT
jgi:hypothetical protein